jgi:hypothetical protein
MMTTTQVSIHEYLSTVYQPDRDYVDGTLEDLNAGHYEHNVGQRAILLWFHFAQQRVERLCSPGTTN